MLTAKTKTTTTKMVPQPTMVPEEVPVEPIRLRDAGLGWYAVSMAAFGHAGCDRPADRVFVRVVASKLGTIALLVEVARSGELQVFCLDKQSSLCVIPCEPPRFDKEGA